MGVFEETMYEMNKGTIVYGDTSTDAGKNIELLKSDSEEWIAPPLMFEICRQHSKIFASPLHNSRYVRLYPILDKINPRKNNL